MHRYAAGFAAGALFLAVTETAVLARALNRALTNDDSAEEEDNLTLQEN